MHILLISNFFPPVQNTACNRILSFARYWTEAGHKVTVLTTEKHPSLDGALIERAPDLNSDLFKLIEVPYVTVPETQGPPSQTTRSSRSRIRTLAPTLLDRRARWYLAARRMPLEFMEGVDIIVGSHPVVYAFFLASFLGRKFKKKFVLDYRDLWTADPGSYKSILPIRILEKVLEKHLIARAAATVTVSDGQALMMKESFGCQSQVVENGFETEVLRPGQLKRQARVRSPDKFKIGYFGRFFIPNRDPLPLFESLSKLKANGKAGHLEILFFGDSHPEAVAYIEKYGVADLVKSFPAVSSRQAILEQADCDALLFIDWNDPSLKGVMTGKIYEYAALGVPILHIGGYPGSDAAEFILRHGIGRCFYNDTQALTAFLSNLKDPNEISNSSAANGFETYSRANLARKYLHILEGAVSGQ
ncbi:MAG: glycosyltransferase [Leptospirales bacterium]|nr:glycosyltransferase [Leptospirales bacterium]